MLLISIKTQFIRDFQANFWQLLVFPAYITWDSGYPHDGRADKNPYPHDHRADKDSYPHDSKNQCIILRLQLSFVMINVQLIIWYLLDFATNMC